MLLMKRHGIVAGLAEVTAYIRANLDQPLNLNEIAERAGFSRFHFHRVFRAVVGEPLAAYVRRERLQRAAIALRETRIDVTTIALQAAYDSPSAFTRAFTDHFGVPPTEFRADASVPIVPPNALPQFRSRAMEFRVAQVPAMRLLGVRRIGTYRRSAPAAFAALVSIARAHRLIAADSQFYGLSYDSPDDCDESQLRFDACITSEAQPVGELACIEFPGGAYALYRHQGPYEFIEHVFDRLFDAVIFSGRYDVGDAPCLEHNLNDPAITEPSELLTDVCIPVA